MRRRLFYAAADIVVLHFATDRVDYLRGGLFLDKTAAQSLGHQAKEPGHGHLYDRRRVLERFGENSSSR